MRRITSRQNPLVARCRAAARGGEEGPLLLDGVHLVTEALAAGLRMRDAAVKAEALERSEIARLADELERAGANVFVATAHLMDALSPVRSSSVVVALADRPATPPSAVYRPTPLVAIAVDVQDPGNMGAIVRVAEAAGASGVIAAGACADPFGWKALRGSMGSALRLPIAVHSDVEAAVADARAHGCRVAATVPREGDLLFAVDLVKPTAVLIGGEGSGLPAAIVAAADDRITIPMQSPVESLNAAVATAIVLYEARRQRTTPIDTNAATESTADKRRSR